jgi:DNA-binding NarL/FixJ family response regulator
MKILMVEDNQEIGERIYARIASLGTTAWLISESEFLDVWPQIAKAPPDVAVVDVMLRWDIPGDEPRPMPEGTDPLYTAGIRCARKIHNTTATSNTRIILYTVIGEADLEDALKEIPDLLYLQKDSDLSPLVEAIRSVTRPVASPRTQPAS